MWRIVNGILDEYFALMDGYLEEISECFCQQMSFRHLLDQIEGIFERRNGWGW